jgi:hypothetical protein
LICGEVIRVEIESRGVVFKWSEEGEFRLFFLICYCVGVGCTNAVVDCYCFCWLSKSRFSLFPFSPPTETTTKKNTFVFENIKKKDSRNEIKRLKTIY